MMDLVTFTARSVLNGPTSHDIKPPDVNLSSLQMDKSDSKPANIGPITAAGDDKDDDNGRENERGVATKSRPKTKKPSMYRVVLMNDDYTPMEFVVMILMGIFKKTSEEAHTIMLNVHQKGVGTCGVYTFEIAETKVAQVMDAAKRNQHPLQCTLEKA